MPRRTIGGFAPLPDSRPSTPPPTALSAQTATDGEATPTPAPAAAPTLDQELQSVMAGIGSFWGKVRKQVSAFVCIAGLAEGVRGRCLGARWVIAGAAPATRASREGRVSQGPTLDRRARCWAWDNRHGR